MTSERAPASGAPGADAWGITDGYQDAGGVWHETPGATRAAILAAMRVQAGAPRTPRRVLVVRAGQPARVPGPAELRLEDGAVLRVSRALPPDLPAGYHELRPLDGRPPLRLIASPGHCHVPPRRAWGWSAQLYATRSADSWGVGDLGDLERLARWSRGLGAGFLMINPLHAATPGTPQEPSPYFPSSRRFLNPLYLRVEAVPGAADAGVDLERLAASARALGAERRIDRDRVYRLKMDALERLWARFGGDPAFEQYSSARGEPLAEFATFCALAERHGRDWRRWPAGYRRPTRPPVARFRMEQAGRVHFHQWLQWLADGQLGQAARELPVMQDLPIAFDPGGADAWTWQGPLAGDVTLGAPPDLYNTRGQDWGLPPFVPHRLTAAAYEPFIQTIRASLRHAAGLRIDHAPGLFRLFWIPEGMDPADGAFVRYPADDLLAIVALESQRAGAFVVGEDLGTVDPDMRERLAAAGVLSYRLLWFEDAAPARYPERALAAVTTHDLPTVAGLWTGADLQAQEALGLQPNARGMREIRDRLRRITGLPDDAGPERVIERAYLLLGEAPSALVAATLDDACATRERPNMPQTTTEWPNWSLALPRTLEQLESDPLPRVVARALGTRDQPRA